MSEDKGEQGQKKEKDSLPFEILPVGAEERAAIDKTLSEHRLKMPDSLRGDFIDFTSLSLARVYWKDRPVYLYSVKGVDELGDMGISNTTNKLSIYAPGFKSERMIILKSIEFTFKGNTLRGAVTRETQKAGEMPLRDNVHYLKPLEFRTKGATFEGLESIVGFLDFSAIQEHDATETDGFFIYK